MTARMLQGLRALDLTDSKGFACGRFLASLGVDTIKVEPPGGEPTRLTPPYAGGRPDRERSLYWLHHNAGKRGITLDLHTGPDRALFLRLVAGADFVIESFTPGHLAELGLEHAVLARANPRLVHTSISPFGQNGPYSRFKANELVIAAMSGVLHVNGDRDRPPVKEALDAHIFHANVAAALASTMAYYHAARTGVGQHVDVSIQEVGVSRLTKPLIDWQFDRRPTFRTGDRQFFATNLGRWIWALKDGFVFYSVMSGKIGAPSNRALSRWLDELGLDNPLRDVDWDTMERGSITQAMRDRWEAAIVPLFGRVTRAEMAEEGPRRGLNTCVALEAPEVHGHPQLAARAFWTQLARPDLGLTLDYPAFLFKSTAAATAIDRPAPAVGEHNDEILRPLRAAAPTAAA
jgi:crotonobetainyl-CoA:carnitine CoA-transferase CaiB-like acyl-CoA transferase